MDTLFDIEPKEKEHNPNKCKTCFYFDWIDYRSGRRIFYCNLRKSNRTHNNKLKIKSNQESCIGYKNV